LTEAEQQEKEELVAEGFEDWSRRDFQQFVRGLEAYGWTEDFALLAADIQDKSEDEVAAYYPVFKKKWKTLSGTCF
jgi:SWI/SNF-related matrix-associated actin-dependent regulator of chromatin subfamily A member 5